MQQLDFWISKRANQSPNKIALIQIETGESWTYKHLMQHVYWWCERFSHHQLPQGARIVGLMENTIESFAILFACRLQKLIYVPLNVRLSMVEQQAIVEDCTPSIVITDEVNLERANSISDCLVILARSETYTKDFSVEWTDEPALPWLIIYTGGTTGKSKGVVLSYEAVTANAINTVISWGLNQEDRTLNYMPLFHTGGINALSLPVLLAGGTVIIGKKFEPERAVRAIDEYETTISLFVPTMYQLMIQTLYFKESTFPTVKVFLSGGAPCPKPIYERFIEKSLKFKEGYGLTEAGPNNFVIDADIAMEKKGAVGKSMMFNEVRVVNDKGEPCKDEEVGELWVKGSHVFLYYWNNEEETEKVLCDGWLKTGDLAKYDADGDYYIVGRKKEMIITGGENVYPQEVEQCLLTHPTVRETTVIGIPDEKWGECIVAFIVSETMNLATEEELRLHCHQSLAKYKVPKRFNFVDELPKTAVGKIDKKQLRQMALFSQA